MILTKHADGTVTATDVQRVERFSIDLLEQADVEVLTWADGVIVLRCANGEWAWREDTRDDLEVVGVLLPAVVDGGEAS